MASGTAYEEYPRIYLYKRIVQAKLFIDENFTRDIELDDMAGEACFSRHHFLRVFSKVYGLTPYQYLVSKRINHAKELLKKGQSVTTVCYACGFESLGSFSALFSKVTGQPPSSYQASELQRINDLRDNPIQYIPGCYARVMVQS